MSWKVKPIKRRKKASEVLDGTNDTLRLKPKRGRPPTLKKEMWLSVDVEGIEFSEHSSKAQAITAAEKIVDETGGLAYVAYAVMKLSKGSVKREDI